jgi:NADPH:quinone reductase
VRVRVLASSVEYTDVTIRRHLYPWVLRRPPFVLGYDVVGEIDQLGHGVSDFRLGDRVADMTVLGSNASYRTIRANRLTRVPAGVDAAGRRVMSATMVAKRLVQSSPLRV